MGDDCLSHGQRRHPAQASILVAGTKKLLEFGDVVFYGFLARNFADPSKYAVTIRGTSGIAEWIIDGDFIPIPHPREPGTRVERGFWGLYESMNLVDLDGHVINNVAADGIANIVGTGRVTIAGHSLGSALATYLSLDTAKHLGPRLSACLFASPHTGDPAWVVLFDSIVSDYRLFNYVLDVVPYVPFDLPDVGIKYAALSQGNSHPAVLGAGRQQPKDQPSWACVIGPRRLSVNHELALSLAALVTHLGVAKQIVELLRMRLHWAGDA